MKTTVVEKYRQSFKKLLLLDYDGTLVNFAPKPHMAAPSARLLDLLSLLARKPSTKVIITTGRERTSIDSLVGHLPIDIIAEHGGFLKEQGRWIKLLETSDIWKQEVRPFMNKITDQCTGSWIEEKQFGIAWHYRNADATMGYILSRRLIRLATEQALAHELRVIDGSKTVEITSRKTSKGIAIKHYLLENDYDYILSVGDDKTDEDMFEALAKTSSAITVKVGQGETLAKFRLENTNDVLDLLEQL